MEASSVKGSLVNYTERGTLNESLLQQIALSTTVMQNEVISLDRVCCPGC